METDIMNLKLSKTVVSDLDWLFEFQTDETAIQMAAFTPEDPFDREVYMAKWTKIVENPDLEMQTIRVDNRVVGSLIHFDMMSETNVSYWIDKSYWGKGIATKALEAFLELTTKRPLYGRTAYDNIGSQRVLEKCGFKRVSEESGFANARNKEIKEFVYRLDRSK